MSSASSVQKNHFHYISSPKTLFFVRDTFFSLSSERIQANFMAFSHSSPLYNSSFCPVESSPRITGQLTVHLFLQGTIHFFFYDFKDIFGGRMGWGNLLLFTIRMTLFEFKIPPCEITLLTDNG